MDPNTTSTCMLQLTLQLIFITIAFSFIRNTTENQDITDRIDRAYKLFFNERKRGNTKIRPPSFKKVPKYKSFSLKKNAGFKLSDNNRIRISKRIYKYSKSRDIEGEIVTLTIKRDTMGDIYLFFSCVVPDPQVSRQMTDKSVGFDFGLKTFITSMTSSEEIQAPAFFNQSLKKRKK